MSGRLISRGGFLLAVIGMVAAAGGRAEADLLVTLENPGVQSSQVAGVTTETFNGFARNQYSSITSSIGTYTSGSNGMSIHAADSYGGSNGSQYIAIGAQSQQLSMTLTLNSPQAYFGFEWLAGDNQNVIKFYNNATLVGTFNVGDLISFIDKTSNSSLYYGNPNNRSQDSGEPFAYVNVIGTQGTTFNRVVFSNSSFGTGFETDNHSIKATAPNPTPGTPVQSIMVPEPSAIVLLSLGVAGCLVSARSPGRCPAP